uniref:EF-hand domain-containing protein n=1 Tax=Chenopodium quinoa TaxID=63459 RepID=A0A803KS53_CHEQI
MSDSEEFAGELYDMLARRMKLDTSKGITIDEMRMFWEDMTSQDFDIRLQIFIDMCDKDGDGMLSIDEVCEVMNTNDSSMAIVLSASANQLEKVKSQAQNYASLIMGELDSDCQGYIELWQLEAFLEEMWTSTNHRIHGIDLDRQPTCPTIFQNINIKGLCGTPEKSYKEYEILLLIGIGTGATFFTSILKDLLNNLKESSTQDIESRKRPEKAYFYWVTSEQGSFDLFKDVVDDIAQYDSDNVIEICYYLTSVYEEGDARSVLIQMVQSLQYARNRVDVISESQAIEFSASTNKLDNLKTQAADYATLIVNELDPDDFGFIEASVDLITQNGILIICNRHPFSIVSAPDDDNIHVLINTSLGEWNAKLLEHFVTLTASAYESSVSHEIGNEGAASDSDLEPKLRSIPHIIMKGPYGVPAQDYKKYDIVLLIGFGLGATLNFSILQDLLNNLQESRTQGIERKKGPHKSYFYWVTSHQSSFDVFKSVFDEIAEYDSDNVIEMNNYLTSVYEEGDARSALIQIVQSLQHAKNGLDVISGTRVVQL